MVGRKDESVGRNGVMDVKVLDLLAVVQRTQFRGVETHLFAVLETGVSTARENNDGIAAAKPREQRRQIIFGLWSSAIP